MTVCCSRCDARQRLVPMPDALFDDLSGGLSTEQSYALLEDSMLRFGLYRVCPRCGGSVIVGP